MVITTYHAPGTVPCTLPALSHKEGIIITILVILELGKVRHQERFSLSNSIAVK